MRVPWSEFPHLHLIDIRITFRLEYVDVSDQGESRVLYTEEVTYRDEVTLAYVPENEAEHKNQKFTGWYLSPALTSAGEPLQGFLMSSDHVRMYAGWTPADRTVRFDVQADPEEVSKRSNGTIRPGREMCPGAGDSYPGRIHFPGMVRKTFRRGGYKDCVGLWKAGGGGSDLVCRLDPGEGYRIHHTPCGR